jgi:hypothetical protein
MSKRLRFSISSLLSWMLILVLAASNVVLYRRLREVEPALEKLRSEMGELTVSDDRLLHAIAVPSFEDSTYRWRIHLPKGRRFVMHAVANKSIPEEGLPEGGSRSTLLSETYDWPSVNAEVLQTVAINKGQRGRWQLILAYPGRQTTVTLPDELQPWLDSNARSWHVAGKEKTVVADVGKPLVLLRMRKTKELPGATTIDMQPTDGILVWIEAAGRD